MRKAGLLGQAAWDGGGGMSPQTDALVTENMGLVYLAAWRAMRRTQGEEFDELVSAGTIGLMQAAERFDPEMGLAFSTLALPRIRGAILDDMRTRRFFPRNRRDLRAVDLDAIDARRVTHPTSSVEHESEIALVSRAILSDLNQQQRLVLACYYFEEMRMWEIADLLGVTESRVSQIRTAALARLRQTLAVAA